MPAMKLQPIRMQMASRLPRKLQPRNRHVDDWAFGNGRPGKQLSEAVSILEYRFKM